MNYRSLSDTNLLTEIRTQAHAERDAGIRVLHCLLEIEVRALHLQRGFGSLHEFLVRELKYSDGAAHRRLNAMRILRELPQVESKLAEGTVTLSTVSQLQDFVRAKQSRALEVSPVQKLELLEAITGKTSRETQVLLAERSPESVIPERVRILSAEEVLVQVKVSPAVLAQLDELKALLVHGLDSASGYGSIIAKLAERVLREEHRKRGVGAPKESSARSRSAAQRLPSRPLRRQTWQRAHQQCEFVDSHTGRRCASRFGLEVDHKMAWSDGGGTTAANLQLLCSAHHRWKTKEHARRLI